MLPDSPPPVLPRHLLPPGTRCPAGASNLAFALGCLPRPARRDMLVFYQFCRVVDDIADDPEMAPEEKLARLVEWENALADPARLPEDLAQVLDRHAIEAEALRPILRGVRSDVQPRSFADWEELRSYCWDVAVAVGLVSNRITGAHSAAAARYAENLGLALQLTNILRDVAEDAALGRVYFSADSLAAHGVTREEILQGRPGPGFTGLWQAQAERAAEYFAAVADGPPPGEKHALRAAEVMRTIYHALLQRLRRDPSRIWRERCRLPGWQKALLLARAFWR